MKYGVGIDISKGKSTIAILSVAGEVRAEFKRSYSRECGYFIFIRQTEIRRQSNANDYILFLTEIFPIFFFNSWNTFKV